MPDTPELPLLFAWADDSLWVSCVFAGTVLVFFLPRVGRMTEGLLLPAGLLLLRKIFLFLPVPGALSSADHVVFWSVGALLFFVLFIPLLLIAILNRGMEMIPALFAGALFVSGLLLPIDGVWSHLAMPFVSAVAAPKVVLVQPLLLPLAAAGYAGQLCLALLRRGRGARELNKLLVVLLLAGGLLQHAIGIGSLGVVRSRLGEIDDTEHFLDLWASNLDGIAQCGVHLIEQDHVGFYDNVYENCEVRNLVKEVFHGPEVLLSRMSPAGLGTGALIFVVLLLLVERLRREGVWREVPWNPEAGGGGLADGEPGTILEKGGGPFDLQEVSAPDDPIPAAVPPVLYFLGCAFLALGILGVHPEIEILEDWSGFILGLGFACLAGALVTFESLPVAWISDNRTIQLRAFAGRDRRGRAIPGWGVPLGSVGTPDRSKLLANQPDAALLALAARGSSSLNKEIAKALGLEPVAGDLEVRFAQHPACPVLARIAFATRAPVQAAAEAVQRLPDRLWPRALRALLRSDVGATRRAALRFDGIPRSQLLRRAGGDRDGEVRRAAWERLQGDLATSEVAELSRSEVPEVVRWAIGSRKLSRWRLRRLAANKKLPAELRMLASERLRELQEERQ